MRTIHRAPAMTVLVCSILGPTAVVAIQDAGKQPSAQSQEDARRRQVELVNKPVVLRLPGMDRVTVRENLDYTGKGDSLLRMDVYSPPAPGPDRRPAVLFIHGGAPTETRPKDWGIYESWGRLAAASALVGITFTHRLSFPKTQLAEGAADVQTAIDYVRTNAEQLGVDGDRLCLAAYSAGGPMLSLAMGENAKPYIRCLVAFYAFMDVRQSSFHRASDPPELLERLSPIVVIAKASERTPPLFLARAGRDEIPTMNDSIDRFVTEAVARNLTLDFVNHPQGVHGFDNQTDDERSREIVSRALDFMKLHLGAAGQVPSAGAVKGRSSPAPHRTPSPDIAGAGIFIVRLGGPSRSNR